MNFFDNLSEIISEKGKEAAEAAKKVAEIANLKSKISSVEMEVRKNYRKIGEAYYEAYKNAEVSCEFEEYVQAIRDSKKKASELTYKLNELKGELKCKGCGNQIKADSAFCSKCGMKVEIEYFDEEDDLEEECEEVVVEAVVDAVEEEPFFDEVEELEELEEIEE